MQLQDLNTFSDIKLLYTKLDKDASHFVNSNDICTPIDCVKEMVDVIPNEVWKRKGLKVLDSCCGNGNFHAYIQTKTHVSNLYFNEINPKRIDNVKRIFGNNINITDRDFLTFEDKEEYDIVVSNPPYAKFDANNKRVSKNHNLSRDFIRKALAITKKDGYILFIVPNNWMSYADRNILPKLLSQYQFIHLNINGAKKWFPKVGSSFTWFLLKKSPNKTDFTVENNYVLKGEEKTILGKDINYIPLYYSNIVKSIIDKTLNTDYPKYKVETTSYLHRYTKKEFIQEEKDTIFKYRLIHTPTQTVYSKVPHKYQNGYKVFISLSNQYSTFVDNCGMTQSIAFIRCHTKAEAKKIQEELKNDIFIFLNNITRYGNFNNVRILQTFPLLEYICLTQQEKYFIYRFNQIYYGKE